MISRAFHVYLSLVFAWVLPSISAEIWSVYTSQVEVEQLAVALDMDDETITAAYDMGSKSIDLSRISTPVKVSPRTLEFPAGSGNAYLTLNNEHATVHGSRFKTTTRVAGTVTVAFEYVRRILYPFHSYW
ncbi:hypothetical protein [Nonlabens marinus]|uniref:Uncharacterized protein n=1 Tax=Nonlabens marinus S1-08 TaxID=1454201 RepID=W8VVR1_9FLAO|nr:hypothetical protein [Nonlabens marinus]BAO54097.1 hypothetical protein NMS_0088 [Nonlabens marinus S1-08]